MPETEPVKPVERYWAVLCRERVPSTSMAHEERWYGPHDTYPEAVEYVEKLLASGSTYISGHVCKRMERADLAEVQKGRH